jgi:hypothetical protein
MNGALGEARVSGRRGNDHPNWSPLRSPTLTGCEKRSRHLMVSSIFATSSWR